MDRSKERMIHERMKRMKGSGKPVTISSVLKGIVPENRYKGCVELASALARVSPGEEGDLVTMEWAMRYAAIGKAPETRQIREAWK
ncbi:MAG: hypothetical protein MR609_06960 [Bacteroidales bacterium]|nr:hypothetical protein [Bacteroidales bacterium]